MTNTVIYPKQQPGLQLPLAQQQQQAYLIWSWEGLSGGEVGGEERGAFPIVLFIRGT